MKFIMAITLALGMTLALVKAQDEDGPDGEGDYGSPRDPPRGPHGPPRDEHGGPRGHGGKRGPPPPISLLEAFPACANIAQAVRKTHKDMMRNGQIGLQSCPVKDDFRTCWRRSLDTVRCAITETPSDDCIDQINSFIKGNSCNSATTENSSLNDYKSTLA